MASSVSPSYLVDREAVTRSLKARGKTRSRKGDPGETWLDHSCLFHEDAHNSAAWEESTGNYYCRTCDQRYPVPEVLLRLGLPSAEKRNGEDSSILSVRAGSAKAHLSSGSTPAAGDVLTLPPIDTYEYRFPDGTLSHLKHVQGEGSGKKVRQEGPNGESSVSNLETYPIFGDLGAPAGANLIVVEGEKCVLRVQAMADTWRDQPIIAITCGSVSDLSSHAQVLATRVGELQPRTVLLWPDNDGPGFKAMAAVGRSLRSAGIPFQALKPAHYNLPPKGDVVEFVGAGNSLAGVFSDHFGAGQKVEQLVAKTACARNSFVLPHSRELVKNDTNHVTMHFLSELGFMPKDSEVKELGARLRQKGYSEPIDVHFRLAQLGSEVYWRPAVSGRCYRIAGTGVTLAEDPPASLIIAAKPRYPVEVDLAGTREDLEKLCHFFNLPPVEVAMVEGWLVAALLGLETPIMLMRGQAGSGKTSLARLILAVLEPSVPEFDAGSDQNADTRQFLRFLQRAPMVLMDNVSRFSASMEDVLSKLVTGFVAGLRALYEDSIEMLYLRRAIIVTTINWDVYKGDLSQRMIVVNPSTRTQGLWMPASDLYATLAPQLARIRGHIFRQASVYLASPPSPADVGFRIGDLGKVFHALGYNVDEIAREEAVAKTAVIGSNDPWLEAIVAWWEEQDPKLTVMTEVSADKLLEFMFDYGIENLPPKKSNRIARYMSEKGPIFRDHGFSVEAYRSNRERGYRFRRLGHITPPEAQIPEQTSMLGAGSEDGEG